MKLHYLMEKFDCHYQQCPICRNPLLGKCISCQAGLSSTDRPTICGSGDECNIKSNTVCSKHYFHINCINTWTERFSFCPLCMAPWVDAEGLNLMQLSAVKLLNNEEDILDLVYFDVLLDPKIFSFLTDHTKFMKHRTRLIPEKQRLLAKTFAPYLTEDELNELLKIKKRDQKPNENKNQK